VNALLAQAYTEQRTIELRMPGAGYGRMRVERGPQKSSFSQPKALLKAKPLIKDHLSEEPDSPNWLQAEGWAELLAGEYSPAIQSFNRALEKRPSSTELMRDTGTAYFERGEAEGRDSDYRNASQLLDRSLTLNPNDPVALFNRAIVNERLSFYNNAINDLNHYLQIDSTSEWAIDARRRVEELQRKIKEHAESFHAPLLSAEGFVQEFSRNSVQATSATDRRIEDYLHQAVIVWLPRAFPESPHAGEAPDATAISSLKILGQILAERHGDQWLKDLMSLPISSRSGLAIRELSKAVRANTDEDIAGAEKSAVAAAKIFRADGNQPGLARSLFEHIHALQRAQNGDLCLKSGRKFSGLQTREFKWIVTQWLMEEASCWGKMNDSTKAVQLAQEALKNSEQSNFTDLQLRALAIAADIELSRGRSERAWKYDREGLDVYWRSSSSPLRVYSFYDNLEYIAEDALQWDLARAAGLEAVIAISDTPKNRGKAMAHFRLASADRILGRSQEAAEEFGQARKLFATDKDVESSRKYALFSQLSLADLQVQNGEIKEGLAALLTLEPQLRGVSNYLIPLQLYRAMASAYLKLKQYSDSQGAAARAIEVAEDGLRSISSSSERIVWRNETNPVYRIFLESYWQTRHDSESALRYWEWYHAASQRQRQGSMPKGRQAAWTSNQGDFKFDLGVGADLNHALTRLVKAGKGLLVYAQVPDGIIIWSSGENGIESYWIPLSTKELAGHIQRFVSYCSDPESDVRKLKEEGRYLYGVLVAPIEKTIQPKADLIVELDGVISRLPVEALVDRDGHYVGETHAVSISLGMAYLKYDAEGDDRALTRNERALIVNPPSSAGDELDLPPLPDAAREAEMVAAEFPNSKRLAGTQATLAALQNALPNATVFHFAGHAFILGQRSGLLLARDESPSSSSPLMLDADQIRRLNLRHLNLVVLSSCTTEDTGSRFADDPDSVVGAFLRAGVKHVVASRWNVDSTFTLGLIHSFYSQASLAHTVSESLQLIPLHSDSKYAHPYFWASLENFDRAWI
jgi:CHAT domain-containing protein